MKNNTVKGILAAAFIVAGSVSSFAQSPTLARRQVINDSLSKTFARRSMNLKQEAIAMAAVKGWPLTIVKEDSYSELMRVSEEGTPIYYKTSNAGSAITSRANRLYPNGSAGLSLTGKGVRGGIWDGNHPLLNHLSFGGRVSAGDTFGIESLHPTHVAGTMVGKGGTGETQIKARGIAYEGTLKANNWTNDDAEMADQASTMVVSNHSYGLDAEQNFPVWYFGAYNADSKSVDAITFNNPYYQPVIAAGNDRGGSFNATKGGYDLLTTQGTAKNAIVVAAIAEVNNYTGPNSVNIASFSNYGPTDDYRIKPDIANKGVSVYSSSNSSIAAYATLSGTSMAAPGVSGVIMLLQQHFSNLHPSDDPSAPNYMRSATVRGLIAHTADEIGANRGPDAMTGWGLINAEASALALSRQNTPRAIVDEKTLANNGTYTVKVKATGGERLIATLSWTDRPGVERSTVDVHTPTLINDLNLRVESVETGDLVFPWMLTPSYSGAAAVRGNNKVDNIEKIEIDAPAGEYIVTVSHVGALTGGSQDYSLIVTGIDSHSLNTEKYTPDFFAVWPNPATDILNIKLTSGNADGVTATLFDIQGRQVIFKKITASSDYINVANLSKGLYIVKMEQGGKQYVKKVMIK